MSTSEGVVAQQRPVDWADRRDRQRVVYCTQVNLTSETNFYTGFSNNVSEGGIFVATHVLRAHGSVMEVEFSLPDGGPPIRVESVVRWVCDDQASERPGMGLQFQNLAEADRRRIEAFVQQRGETIFYED
jgi:uncharacterized protein (TIGR02266 family)